MADFSGKGSMQNRDVIVTFPANKGVRYGKDGQRVGFYADVELNQTQYGQDKSVDPQTNPHLVTTFNKNFVDKNGKSLPNHRVSYSMSQVNTITKAGSSSKLWTLKGKDNKYTEYTTDEIQDIKKKYVDKYVNAYGEKYGEDKSKQMGANAFNKHLSSALVNVRVAVNASLMTKAGSKNSVIINTKKPITPSKTPFEKGSYYKQTQAMHQAKLDLEQMSKNPEAFSKTNSGKARDVHVKTNPDPVFGLDARKDAAQKLDEQRKQKESAVSANKASAEDKASANKNPIDDLPDVGETNNAPDKTKTDDTKNSSNPIDQLDSVKGSDTEHATELTDGDSPFQIIV